MNPTSVTFRSIYPKETFVDLIWWMILDTQEGWMIIRSCVTYLLNRGNIFAEQGFLYGFLRNHQKPKETSEIESHQIIDIGKPSEMKGFKGNQSKKIGEFFLGIGPPLSWTKYDKITNGAGFTTAFWGVDWGVDRVVRKGSKITKKTTCAHEGENVPMNVKSKGALAKIPRE